MNAFIEKTDYAIVSLIIPQGRLNACLSTVLSRWPYKAIHFDCRGTMVREHWFQSFLPIMNPECEYLQFLLKSDDLSGFVDDLVSVNDLHLPGAGAVFTARCVYYSSNHVEGPIKRLEHRRDPAEASQPRYQLKQNLYAIFALIQSGRTETAIKAAMQAGSHGPIVYFVEGRGTRDRIGWLKITKKPYEEVVMVLVEDIDRVRVKEALVTAGRVGTLGGGIVFEMPLEQGLVNLPTSIQNSKRLASTEQIISAVDQLMGNTDWRDRRSLDSLLEKNQAYDTQALQPQDASLCALIPRKYSDDFLDYVLSIGVPGVNINYSKLFSDQDSQNKQQVSIHHELALIRMVLPVDACVNYRQQLQQYCSEQGYKNVTFFQLAVEGVVQYQPKPRSKVKAVYRGVTPRSEDANQL